MSESTLTPNQVRTAAGSAARVTSDTRPPVRHDSTGDVGQTVARVTPQEISAGHIFVMGDNRTNSLDSRSFGPVPDRGVVAVLDAS